MDNEPFVLFYCACWKLGLMSAQGSILNTQCWVNKIFMETTEIFVKASTAKGSPLGERGRDQVTSTALRQRMSWVGTIPVTALELHACTVVSWVILSRALCTSLLFLACVATMPIQLTVKPTPYVWEIGPAGLVVNEATIHWFWQGAVLLSNVSICSVLWLRP